MSASSCRCAPGCGRASAPARRRTSSSCYFGAVVVIVLGLFSRRLSAYSDARVMWRGVELAWERVTWLCELFGRAKTTLCACEAAAPKSRGRSLLPAVRRFGSPAQRSRRFCRGKAGLLVSYRPLAHTARLENLERWRLSCAPDLFDHLLRSLRKVSLRGVASGGLPAKIKQPQLADVFRARTARDGSIIRNACAAKKRETAAR